MKFSFTYHPEFGGLENQADMMEFNGLPLSKIVLKIKGKWFFHDI